MIQVKDVLLLPFFSNKRTMTQNQFIELETDVMVALTEKMLPKINHKDQTFIKQANLKERLYQVHP